MLMKTINRELSWINFNRRVISLSTKKKIPMVERLKFLGISFANLNEFLSVRFAYIVDAYARSEKILDDLGEKIDGDVYDDIRDAIIDCKEEQYSAYKEIIKDAKEDYGLKILSDLDGVKRAYRECLEEYFINELLPIITPIAYDTTKEPPIFKDKDLQILVSIKDSSGKKMLCVVAVPHTLPRFIKLDGRKYVYIESVVKYFMPLLFRGKKITGMVVFKTYKNLATTLDVDDNEYILDRMRKYLSSRDTEESNIFIDIQDDGNNGDLHKLLYRILDVYKGHVFKTKYPLGLESLAKSFIYEPKLMYPVYKPYIAKEIVGCESVMEQALKEDIVLHHPFETYDTVIDLIKEASENPDVISIKQTLYRVSSKDSPIIDALCNASKNNKAVSVLLELKARFDEKQNIALVTKLKEAGCNITYGVEELKVHAKFCIISKRMKKGLKTICHIGTGNYNEMTSKIYTDISYITSRNKIGNDLNNLFNSLAGFSEFHSPETINISPYGIRDKFIDLIDREIENCHAGKRGFIFLKLNSLCDRLIIEKLYEAAENGVMISILCRGICSIVARKNIEIRSVVGRFLEHSRIYYFSNGGEDEVYISSADLMTRNLDRRVEIMVEVKEEQCITKIKEIISLYLTDNYNTQIMNKKGSYSDIHRGDDVKKFDVHQRLMSGTETVYKIPKKKKKKEK